MQYAWFLQKHDTGSAQDQLRPKWVRLDKPDLPRGSYQQNGILYIQNVRREDAGRYSCQTLDRTGRMVFESFVQLTVAGGHSIKIQYI